MKALTLIQPWAWAITHAGKRVENRSWKPDPRIFGKPIALHAGLKYDYEAAADICEIASVEDLLGLPNEAMHADYLPKEAHTAGAIVAVVTVVDVVSSPSELPDDQWDWFFGPFGWVLSDVRPLAEPVPCRGALSLWDVPAIVERGIRRQAELAF